MKLYMKKLRLTELHGLAILLLNVAFLSVFMAFCVSCTEIDVDAPKVPETVDPVTENQLTITPSAAMPATTVYYFYHTTESRLLTFPAQADGSFDGVLPLGTYRMLAIENTRSDVVLRSMEDYATAAVCLLNLDDELIPDGTYGTICRQPENIQVLQLGEVVIGQDAPSAYTVDPIPLIKTINLTFDVSQVDEAVVSVSGTLNGVHPAVSLRNAAPADTDRAPRIYTYFEGHAIATRAETNQQFRANISSFGLLNPKSGNRKVYKLQARLTLQLENGETRYMEVDLVEEISALMDENGNLPIDVEIEIPVESSGLSTDPIDPTDPEDPVYPTDPTDPTDPDPIDPEPETPTEVGPGGSTEEWKPDPGKDLEGEIT